MVLHDGEFGVDPEDTVGAWRLWGPCNVDVVSHGWGWDANKTKHYYLFAKYDI